MMIKINDDREFEIKTLYSGYLEENNSTTIEFEFPEYLEKYNKKLNFMLADGTTVCKLFDDINSNKFTFTRDLLKFNKLQMAIEFFDTEENLIYRTSILTIIISDSIICDDDVSPEDSKVVILNELIQKVNELNTEITENEATRESNEQTRISNEDTRVANETARQEYVTQLKKDVELGNFDGATFTPHVSESGDLSWSNNKGLENPTTVNIKGEKGDKGDKGEKGDTGVGISKLEVIDGALYVTLTNNVKENAGVILTDEVKSWLVSQITDNAESDFNTYYNSKVEEFNTNADEKLEEYNTNAEDKLSEYNTNATEKISEYNNNAEAILKILPKTETEVLEVIDVDDAGESSFNKLSVYGNSRQESTEGYNLLVNNLESATINGLDFKVNEDKSITINGTASDATVVNLLTGHYVDDTASDPLVLPDNITNAIITGCPEGGSGTTYKLDVWNNVSNFVAVDYGNGGKFNTKVDFKNIARVRIVIYKGATLNNLTFKPMILSGTEEKPYEPYTGGTASPNPDYPQEIESIKDSITFKRIGKNYIPFPYQSQDMTLFGVDFKINSDRSITMSGTSTNESCDFYLFGSSTDNNNYLIFRKGDYKLSQIENTGIIYIAREKTLGALIGNSAIENAIKNQDCYFYGLLIRAKKSTVANDIIYPQIEKGTKATEYEPYHEDNYTLPVQQNMYALVEGQEDCFVKKDGQWYERHYSFEAEFKKEMNLNISISENRFVIFNMNFLGYLPAIYNQKTKQLSNYFIFSPNWGNKGFYLAYNNLYFEKIVDTVDEFKQWISKKQDEGNPLKIVYIPGSENGKIVTPTDLECTPEQTAVLNQLEQFYLEKGVNHIFSDDELSPKFKLKYYQDMNILLDKINKNIADVSAQLL